MVIGYELVSYLLLYSSVRCVTFKELFVCKGSYFYWDFWCIPSVFSWTFFRKRDFIRRHTIVQKDFERPCADYCISGEKGFASRLNNLFRLMKQGPFLLCLCQRGAFTGFWRFSFFVVPLSRKRKTVYDRTFHKWNKPSLTAGKPGRMILSIRPNSFGQTDKNILLCWWFARFHATGCVFSLPWVVSFSRISLLKFSSLICLYFRLPPFLRLSVSRIRQSFSCWVQR